MNDEIKIQWLKRKVRELGRLLSGLPEDRRRAFESDILPEPTPPRARGTGAAHGREIKRKRRDQ